MPAEPSGQSRPWASDQRLPDRKPPQDVLLPQDNNPLHFQRSGAAGPLGSAGGRGSSCPAAGGWLALAVSWGVRWPEHPLLEMREEWSRRNWMICSKCLYLMLCLQTA